MLSNTTRRSAVEHAAAPVAYSTKSLTLLYKYTRAFDVIDVLYQSLRTSLNVYSTYESVSDRISDYKKLLDDYNERVIKRKRISVADTILIGINKRAIENIAKEGEYLYKSVSDLVLYAVGGVHVQTGS